ncbi:MAG: carboxypeptidase-like regulatory domain-containing protein [Bacteroidaceae bacterium]|nr:carboxypeptidase-like regulatory domain-containing protein [Bacteroidaceae bacterium]
MKRILLILFTLLPVSMMGQVEAGDSIHGKVTDEEGKPLMMANIIEVTKEKRIIAHAVSDVNGNYSLKIVDPKNTLMASLLQYKSVRKPISSHTINFALESNPGSDQMPPNARIAANAPATNMGNDDGEPLIIVDGKVIKAENHIDYDNLVNGKYTDEQIGKLVGINPKDIVYLTIDAKNVGKTTFGDKGKNGVIKIRTEPFEPLESIVKKYVPGGRVENGHIIDKDGKMILSIGGGEDPYANNIWYDLNYDYNYQGNDSTKKKK